MFALRKITDRVAKSGTSAADSLKNIVLNDRQWYARHGIRLHHVITPMSPAGTGESWMRL